LAAVAASMLSFGAVPAAHASCAVSVVYGGTSYVGTSVSVPSGGALQGAYLPGCNDTVAIDASTGARLTPLEGPTPVQARRIPGLPVSMGVSYNGRAALAAGWLPQVAGHPLSKRWPSSSPVGCGKPWRLRTKVSTSPAPGAPVHIGGGRALTLVGSTRVVGLARDGYPYLGTGDEVDAVVRTCSGAIVADRVARAA
jgi:hypothetical protein